MRESIRYPICFTLRVLVEKKRETCKAVDGDDGDCAIDGLRHPAPIVDFFLGVCVAFELPIQRDHVFGRWAANSTRPVDMATVGVPAPFSCTYWIWVGLTPSVRVFAFISSKVEEEKTKG